MRFFMKKLLIFCFSIALGNDNEMPGVETVDYKEILKQQYLEQLNELKELAAECVRSDKMLQREAYHRFAVIFVPSKGVAQELYSIPVEERLLFLDTDKKYHSTINTLITYLIEKYQRSGYLDKPFDGYVFRIAGGTGLGYDTKDSVNELLAVGPGTQFELLLFEK